MQRLRIVVAIFLLCVVACQPLLTAISPETDELASQVVVVAVSAIDLLYPLCTVDVIIIIGSKHATDGLSSRLLDRITAIGLVLIVCLVETRALRLSVSDDNLIIVDDVFEWRDTCVLKLPGTSRGEHTPCLVDELIPENDLLLQPVDLSLEQVDLVRVFLISSQQ